MHVSINNSAPICPLFTAGDPHAKTKAPLVQSLQHECRHKHTHTQSCVMTLFCQVCWYGWIRCKNVLNTLLSTNTSHIIVTDTLASASYKPACQWHCYALRYNIILKYSAVRVSFLLSVTLT